MLFFFYIQATKEWTWKFAKYLTHEKYTENKVDNEDVDVKEEKNEENIDDIEEKAEGRAKGITKE